MGGEEKPNGGGQAPGSRRALISLIGEILAMGVVALPVLAATMRVVNLNRLVGPTVKVAVALPLGELAALAVRPLLLVSLGAVLIFGIERWLFPGGEVRAEPINERLGRWMGQPLWGRWRGWWILWSAIAVGATLVLTFTAGFPVGPLAMILSLVAGQYVSILSNKGRPISFRALWPTFVLLGVAAVVGAMAGQNGLGVAAAEVSFDQAAHLDDGTYLDLGRSDGMAFLVACDSDTIVSVNASLIEVETFVDLPKRSPGPSLWDVVTEGADIRPIGLDTSCSES